MGLTISYDLSLPAGTPEVEVSRLLAKLDEQDTSSPWSWQSFSKTQYASAHGDDHFVKCHTSVVALLDAAQRIGFACEVYDETDFYESRDESQLLASVDKMNRLIAQFAGRLSDAYVEAGSDSRQVQGEIFRHPELRALQNAPPGRIIENAGVVGAQPHCVAAAHRRVLSTQIDRICFPKSGEELPVCSPHLSRCLVRYSREGGQRFTRHS